MDSRNCPISSAVLRLYCPMRLASRCITKKSTSNSARANTASPPICMKIRSLSDAISASCRCRSSCTLPSICRTSCCNCRLSMAFLPASLSVCSESNLSCRFCSAITWLLSEWSMAVADVGVSSSFLPNKPRNPLRFGLRAASSALFRAMAGTLSAICLWRVFCRRYSAARSFSCDSLFASILRRLSIPFCSERNTLRKEHSVLSITIRCKWYSSLSLSVHSMTVSPRNESPAICMLSRLMLFRSPLVVLFFCSSSSSVCCSLWKVYAASSTSRNMDI